jgi:hypothetical protein
MDVVFHQNPGIAAGFGFFNNSTKALYKIVPIHVVLKNRSALYATHDDMMQGTPRIYSGFTRHCTYLSNQKNDVNR